MGYIISSKSKKEIIRSKGSDGIVECPNHIWDAIIPTQCDIDEYDCLFLVFDVIAIHRTGYLD